MLSKAEALRGLFLFYIQMRYDSGMKLKTNFHFHTSNDTLDIISYTTEEGIDYATSRGFQVLAITCHNSFEWTKEYADYAASKGVLLLPGVEMNVGEKESEYGRHVLILNAAPEAEKVHTFTALEKYRKDHPESFVIAAHPYFYGNISLKEYLEKYIFLFDAIEQSWFHSKWFNRNLRAEKVAKKYDLPFISTSDTHFFDYLDTDYAVIDANDKTPEAIFQAIREKKFENFTTTKRFWKEMVWAQGKFWAHRFRINRAVNNLQKKESRGIVE